MSPSNIKTPGVYVNEINAFPNSVVPVATAVPAFIGYTPQAEYQGKSYLNKPQKVTSMAEFQAIFMLPDLTPVDAPLKQYNPEYYLVAEKEQPHSGDYMNIEGEYYSVLPDPNTIYYLYNSIRLFYANGGGDAYIVSVGSYGPSSNKPLANVNKPLVNPNVVLDDLMAGLALLENETEPTMYICPEATLLSVEDNGVLMQTMLLQAQRMQTAVFIFDVIGARNPDPVMYSNDIQTFRNNTGSVGLNYGVSYYPFVGTSIMKSTDIDYTNLFGGDIKQLAALINPASNPNKVVSSILDMIEDPPSTPKTVSQYNDALINASYIYNLIIKHVLAEANILPPSGAIAGVYTTNDNNFGVWHAPANVSMVGVVNLTLNITSNDQEDLNVDAISGKSVNAIRNFPGQGVLVWGARTLDGNSLDWRYVPLRRAMIMLEQSIKLAARAYIFEPNDANTWSGVKSVISSFLTKVWNEGGLQGTSAADAYQVIIGLGSTMTSEDILNGVMRISVKVALSRPAEFIEITFEQQMATSS
jgi:hypothetical protein